jgi:hypothetical protein
LFKRILLTIFKILFFFAKEYVERISSSLSVVLDILNRGKSCCVSRGKHHRRMNAMKFIIL